MAAPSVHSTHLSTTHSFSKTYTPSINLLTGLGVQGDCHSGPKTQHRSQTASNPSAPNLRQVHLIPYELFQDLSSQNISIQPGELGENITTYGVDLLSLSKGSYLYFGDGSQNGGDVPIVQVTGLRQAGQGIEKHRKGLGERLKLRQVGADVGGKGGVGVMGVVVKGGKVVAGDMIRVAAPQGAHVRLEAV